MKIVISPAKKMNTDTDTLEYKTMPVFLEKAKCLQQWLQGMDCAALKQLWNCSDKIAVRNYGRLREMNLEKNLTPALLSYDGIQYQYMAPGVLEEKALRYVEKHLLILSGFYGVLRPLDGVVPYRLEMQAKAAPGTAGNLYEFWGDRIYREVIRKDSLILNLASREYFQCLEKYRTKDVDCITCVFGEWKEGRVIQKGTLAKMARGEMVRYLAREEIEDPGQIKEFCGLGYCFEPSVSSEERFVFLK